MQSDTDGEVILLLCFQLESGKILVRVIVEPSVLSG